MYPSGSPTLTPVFNGVRASQSLVFCVVICRLLFVLLSCFLLTIVLSVLFSFGHVIICPAFLWTLHYVSFFDLRLPITLLVSSNSQNTLLIRGSKSFILSYDCVNWIRFLRVLRARRNESCHLFRECQPI